MSNQLQVMSPPSRKLFPLRKSKTTTGDMLLQNPNKILLCGKYVIHFLATTKKKRGGGGGGGGILRESNNLNLRQQVQYRID